MRRARRLGPDRAAVAARRSTAPGSPSTPAARSSASTTTSSPGARARRCSTRSPRPHRRRPPARASWASTGSPSAARTTRSCARTGSTRRAWPLERAESDGEARCNLPVPRPFRPHHRPTRLDDPAFVGDPPRRGGSGSAAALAEQRPSRAGPPAGDFGAGAGAILAGAGGWYGGSPGCAQGRIDREERWRWR